MFKSLYVPEVFQMLCLGRWRSVFDHTLHTAKRCIRLNISSIIILLCFWSDLTLAQAWNQIRVKNITLLGPQLSSNVPNVSRDGGYSVLIDGYIVWLYDDTECIGYSGNQLSFVSNTGATVDGSKNVSYVKDYGVVMVGLDVYGREQYAILENETVGTGGWIPFLKDELKFNDRMNGKERVAIWPGTSPTPISISKAFMYAPLVYVDSRPQDPAKEYQPRGMALVTIAAPETGPVAYREGGLVIPGTEVPYGGFATLLGFPSTTTVHGRSETRDVYLIGAAQDGLQLARVGVDDMTDYSKFVYFDPQTGGYSSNPPALNTTVTSKLYMPGTFTSGDIFYSPYFHTYLMVYFNRMVDSTFYIRYLDLEKPLDSDYVWIRGGKNGQGIQPEDAEALVKYAWSDQQTLYASTPGKGGFNYAGTVHPEYYNRQYFASSLYPAGTPIEQRRNEWYGSDIVPERDAGGDGRHLLLSWTSQLQGGADNGIYQVWLAKVEFDDLAETPVPSSTTSGDTSGPWPTSTTVASKTPENMIPWSWITSEGAMLSVGVRRPRNSHISVWLLLRQKSVFVALAVAVTLRF